MKRIDKAVERIAEKHILPNVDSYIEKLTIQATNQWGEKRGERTTFLEYLIQRANNYLTEMVSFEGKSKSEASGYSWNGTQSRLTHLVHHHLHYSIDKAMKEAVGNVHSKIVPALQETVNKKLSEISIALKTEIK